MLTARLRRTVGGLLVVGSAAVVLALIVDRSGARGSTSAPTLVPRSARLAVATTPPQGLPLVSIIQGLGDSVPAADACGCTSFVSLVAQVHATVQQRAMTVTNDAKGGFTSADLLAQATSEHLTARPGSVTIITIGANDFDSRLLSSPGCRASDGLACYQLGLRALSKNVTELLRDLAPAGQAHGIVLVTGYWNVFLDGKVGAAQGPAYVRDSDALTRAVNAELQRATSARGDTFVDLYELFKSKGAYEDELLASDGDHPSASGHALIADTVEQALVSALAQESEKGFRHRPGWR